MNRSQILSLLLVVAITTVFTKTYLIWQEGPWDIPQPAQKEAAAAVAVEEKKEALPVQVAMTTKNIIDNDLFDPERGTNKGKENERLALATQKIRSMVLTGTMILGENRYAIFEDSSDANSKAGGPGIMRFELGDTIEGFRLSQIEDTKVAFTNGTNYVELPLDYFRKVDGAKVLAGSLQAGSPQAVVPPSPRRDRLPPPPRP